MAERMGKYIYSIIRCEQPHQFPLHGISEYGSIVYTVNFQDLAAVVSDSPIIEYERTRRTMTAHTEVLEGVMSEFTILPVRFGTVAPNAEAIIEQLLKRRYDELNHLVDELEGRVELGLKAFWYEGGIFREVIEEYPDIRQFRDQLQGKPPESTHYDRIRLGEIVEAAIQKKRDEDADHILGALQTLSYKTRINKVLTDRMVINAAFLVDRDQEALFDQAVQKLDAAMHHRLMFKYVGPVPPYNFVTIMVVWDQQVGS